MKVLLINPNTNVATTAMMVGVASAHAPAHWEWLSLTAERGSSLIASKEALDAAAAEVAGMRDRIAELGPDCVIVAAFGDPGLQQLRQALDLPVFGIGESAMQAAARLGLPWSIVTITPGLRESTLGQVRRYGCEAHFNSLVTTSDDAAVTARSTESLVEKIKVAIRQAIQRDGSKALVIGGGPVAAAAQELGRASDFIAIQPLVEAVARVKEVEASLPSSSSSLP
ncbi:MAG TPA: aspartate/glutamate racemase family protein [Ramlibacter sp.]|nr:aspartate/glutamate racemase family protein [Ramlibacter sp.]